jgi:hypothetical protein
MALSTTLPDDIFLEMRWRCLSLAADMDRTQRQQIADERIELLRQALRIVLDDQPDRAGRVQMLLSDQNREIKA